jgi:ankyrin repeat protein
MAAVSSKRTLNELGEREKHFIYRKCLLDAATDGNLGDMKRTIVDHRLSRDDISKAKDLYGRTALILASMSGHLPCLEYLVSLGARVNVQDKTGWTALSWAARGGHLDTIKFLASNGANLDAQDVFGMTALSYAATYDNRAEVEYLVARGATVPQDQLATWPKPVADAVKLGQRNLVIDDEKKKRSDRAGISIAKKALLPLATASGANAQLDKEQRRNEILTDELRVMVNSDCNCALKASRKCNFFESEEAQ